WQHLTKELWDVVDTLKSSSKVEEMESLQRAAGHLIAPFARAGSTLHLANPTGNPISVQVVKDGSGTNIFGQNLKIRSWDHTAVLITSDAAPLFVEDGNSPLVATLEAPLR